MPFEPIATTPSAYTYPLLIKQLLHSAKATAGDQEIVYRDHSRYTYRQFFERIGRLANALSGLGIAPGDTVAVMDWDSHRYLEAFFAVPMMGAVLQTVNVRLSPEQILYTLNHAKADIVAVNVEFIPILAIIKDQLETVKKFILISDDGATMSSFKVPYAGEYEALAGRRAGQYDFPDFDENTRATTFYTTGTTGLPKGVYFSHRQLVLHTLATPPGMLGSQRPARAGCTATMCTCRSPRCSTSMPGACPTSRRMLGLKQVYPGRYAPEGPGPVGSDEKVTFSHCVPTILHMLLTNPGEGGRSVRTGRSSSAAQPAQGLAAAAGPRHRRLHRLRHVGNLPHPDHRPVQEDLPDAGPARPPSASAPAIRMPLVDLHTVDENLLDVERDGKSNRRDRRPRTVADPGLPAQPGGARKSCGPAATCTPATSAPSTRRLPAGDRPHEGRHQDRRRVGVLARAGKRHLAAPGGQRSRGHRRQGRQVGRAAAGHDRPAPEHTATVDEIKQHVLRFAEEGHISKFAVPEQVRFVDSLARTSVGKLNKKAMREQLA
jgi:fatty-acyl-CoA synthase